MEKMTLTVKEAAQALGISLPTAYEYVHREDFPSFHIGKRILVNREGLKEWMLRQQQRRVEG